VLSCSVFFAAAPPPTPVLCHQEKTIARNVRLAGKVEVMATTPQDLLKLDLEVMKCK
jgi:hypothetical protein